MCFFTSTLIVAPLCSATVLLQLLSTRSQPNTKAGALVSVHFQAGNKAAETKCGRSDNAGLNRCFLLGIFCLFCFVLGEFAEKNDIKLFFPLQANETHSSSPQPTPAQTPSPPELRQRRPASAAPAQTQTPVSPPQTPVWPPAAM